MIKRSSAFGLTTLAAALAVPVGTHATAPPTSEPATSEPLGSAPGAAVDLSGVCPETIVIQTDWFPESEYGAVYNLLGDDYEIDTDNVRVTGPLVSGGEPTGVDIEIRAGGVAGSGDVETLMYTDDSIHFAFGTTDGQILAWENTPLMSVVAPLEINPQVIMWDPETYPDVETLADLGEQGIVINVFEGQTATDFFVATGVWSEDQIDSAYSGQSGFIAAGGEIAQQGFASAEPFQLEHVNEDWGKPVRYQLFDDAGFSPYSQTLAIRPDDLETLGPCLELFVPVVQRSAVEFINDPARTNAAIVDIVEQYDSFWEYPLELAEYAVATMLELGLVGNGPDDTIGNMDPARIETVLQQVRDAGLEVPDDLTADQLFTNEFIDESIGL